MAAYMIEDSVPAMHAESQLFSVPVSYTDRWRYETERINPTTILTDDGTSGDINFYIPPSTNAMLDLSNVTLDLELAVKVRSGSGTWEFVGPEDLVAPVNNILHSLFQSVTLQIGNRVLSDAGSSYPYRAHLESLLFHSRAHADSILGNAGYRTETPDQLHNCTGNASAEWRRALVSKKEFVEFSGKLACDLLQQEKPLLTGVSVNVRLVAGKKEFYLIS